MLLSWLDLQTWESIEEGHLGLFLFKVMFLAKKNPISTCKKNVEKWVVSGSVRNFLLKMQEHVRNVKNSDVEIWLDTLMKSVVFP